MVDEDGMTQARIDSRQITEFSTSELVRELCGREWVKYREVCIGRWDEAQTNCDGYDNGDER